MMNWTYRVSRDRTSNKRARTQVKKIKNRGKSLKKVMGKPQNRKKSNKINMNNNISKMMKLMLKIRRRNHKKIIKNSMNKSL